MGIPIKIVWYLLLKITLRMWLASRVPISLRIVNYTEPQRKRDGKCKFCEILGSSGPQRHEAEACNGPHSLVRKAPGEATARSQKWESHQYSKVSKPLMKQPDAGQGHTVQGQWGWGSQDGAGAGLGLLFGAEVAGTRQAACSVCWVLGRIKTGEGFRDHNWDRQGGG